MRRERAGGAWIVCVCCSIAFVVLTVLVATNATDRLDDALRDVFRPDDEWGPLQVRVDRIVEGLRPPVMAVLFAAVAIGWSLRRRSWWPAAYAAGIAGSAVLVVEVTKVLLSRPDPHGEVRSLSGSYPSGHTVSVLVCLGGALLVVRSRTIWWQWLLVGVAGAAMGLALLIQAAHWATDVVGGALLATAVLSSASLWPLRRRSCGGGAATAERAGPASGQHTVADQAFVGDVP